MDNNFLKKPIKITEQRWDKDTIPLVSVFNWVYNHKDFIHESIDSILIQETTFPVEIIIHDDASNDGTLEVIQEYERKHPQLFKNVIQLENQWSQGKSVMFPLFERPRGKYIALTHGDDYWTDPLKLQKQVDFLEQNNEYIATCHNTLVVQGEMKVYQLFNHPSMEYFFHDLLKDFYMKTNTLMFKNIIIDPHRVIDDTTLGLFLLDSGNKAFYDTNVMASYRKHSGGIQSLVSAIDSFHLNKKTLDLIVTIYSSRYSNVIQKYSYYFFTSFGFKLVGQKYFRQGIRSFLKSFKYDIPITERIKLSLSFSKWLVLSYFKKVSN